MLFRSGVLQIPLLPVWDAVRRSGANRCDSDHPSGGDFGSGMPYALSFAAGAMVYVVVEELIPEMSVGKHSNVGTILFAVGFTLMMTLDVALG